MAYTQQADVSRNGGVQFWFQVDFPSNSVFEVRGLAIQKRGDGASNTADRMCTDIQIDYLDEADQWVSYQSGATFAIGQTVDDPTDYTRYVDFTG
jgi:hypothetical protein